MNHPGSPSDHFQSEVGGRFIDSECCGSVETASTQLTQQHPEAPHLPGQAPRQDGEGFTPELASKPAIRGVPSSLPSQLRSVNAGRGNLPDSHVYLPEYHPWMFPDEPVRCFRRCRSPGEKEAGKLLSSSLIVLISLASTSDICKRRIHHHDAISRYIVEVKGSQV